MPELPEVETVVRGLQAALAGRVLSGVEVRHTAVLRHPAPEAFVAGLSGARVESVTRRGKYIHCSLDTGDVLLVHLGMTGRLSVTSPDAEVPPHTHIVATLDDGRELRFTDTRRFGRVLLGSPDQLQAQGLIPLLGVEPLGEGFTAAALDAVLRRTTRPLKAALLDQRGIAGLGNIYVDEICFDAGVRPQRRCHTLRRRDRAALLDAVPRILDRAIANRGSSIRDYRDAAGDMGRNQHALLAYGRAGQPCVRCGTVLRRTVVAGRTTTYCPRCQR